MSLRRLRDDRPAAIGLMGLVLMTAFVFAVGPRLLGQVADRALRDEVAAAPASVRDIQLVQERRIGPGAGDPLGAVDAAGAELEAQVPATVSGLFVDRVYTADTPRWDVTSDTKTPSLLTLRVEQDVADHIRYVAGRPPTGELQTVFPPGTAPSGVASLAREVALSTDTAAEMGVELGDTLQLVPDSTDPLGRGHNDHSAVEVVGLFEVPRPDEPYWSDDTTLELPTTRALTADLVFVNAIALLAPDAYPELMSATEAGGLPMRYAWRYRVDPRRLAAGSVDDVLVGLRRLESVFPTSAGVGGAAKGTILRSGLLSFIDGQQARWRSAQAVLTAVAIGPAAVAGAALGLVVLLGSGRRRAALVLSRSRGASTAQIVGATAGEGLALAVPAALAAVALALMAIPGGFDPATVVIPLVVATITVVLLVAAIAPTAFGSAVAGRAGGEGRRAGPRRIAFELLVIALAIGGAVLLRDRGVLGASSTGALGGADPFIAAVPALAGLAAGLIAIRLFSVPVRGLAALAGLRRDLVPVLGLRRTTRSGSAAPILLVLLATAAVGAFSLATLAHLDRANEAVSWQEVGAPFRLVEGAGRLAHDFDPTTLPRVGAVAGAYRTTLTDAGRVGIELLALDGSDYRTVVSGTPADVPLPATGPVEPGGALAAIVSTRGVVDGIAPGDRFQLRIGGEPTTLVAAAVVDAFPSLPVGGPFVVVDRPSLAALRPKATLRTSTVFLSAPDDAAGAIRAAMAHEAPGTTVDVRAERSEAIRTAPVVVAVTIGVEAAFIVAVVFAAIALAAALALTGAARAEEAAHLRTLGLGRAQRFGLPIVEHGPTVVLAVIVGVAFGLAVFVALRPGLGLGAIVGSALDIPLSVGPGQVGLLVGAIMAIVALAMGVGVAVQREPAAPAALRRGME
jgi:putative ABC transport system permease protein